MFEAMTDRASRKAGAKAEARRAEIAGRLTVELPRGIRAEADGNGVTLHGPALARRYALDARLRWLIAESVR